MLVLGAGKGAKAGVTLGMEQVMEGLQSGLGLTEAMREAGLSLPPEAWSLLEAGEATGRLGETMIETGHFLRQQGKRRHDFLGQLWYPALVTSTGLVVMGIILFWVVPQMRDISQSMGMGEELPWLTENIGLLYSVAFAAMTLSLSLLGLLALLWSTLRKKTGRVALIGEIVLNWTPLYGTFRRMRRQARLSRQLGILVKGAVTLPRALSMAAKASPDFWERSKLEEFRTRLVMGAGFDEALEACPLFEADSHALLKAGQESGRLDHYLIQDADDLESRSARALSLVIRFLEPVMLLVLSVAIGGLILAYLLPMVGMLERLA